MPKTAPDKVHEVLGQYILADGYDIVIDLEKSQGSYIVDEISGKKYLDMWSCFASVPLGWNVPEVVERKDELLPSAINKPSNSDLYSTYMADFVDTFGRVAKPDHFKYMFFVSGGALAVENAIKAAFDWKTRKLQAQGIEATEHLKIIHFRQAFHGRSGYTLSLTNTADPRKTMYFPKFDWPRVTNPKLSFPVTKENTQKVVEMEEQAIQEIKEAVKQNENQIAGLLIEPIQGEGGDNHFRDEFFVKLREICDEEDMMFILDEVQTGFGLTGKMWAHEHNSVNPDIIAFGKKAQACGIMSTDRIDEVKYNVFHESSRISTTWGANLVDMVRAMMYCEVIEENNILDNVVKQGEYLLEKLTELQENYPDIVSNVRGTGLMCAFDLPDTKMRDDLQDKIFEEGAIIIGSGTNSIRFRPYLNVSKDEIDEGVEIVNRALNNL